MIYAGQTMSDSAFASVTRPGGLLRSTIGIPVPGILLEYSEAVEKIGEYFPTPDEPPDPTELKPYPEVAYEHWNELGHPFRCTIPQLLGVTWGREFSVSIALSGRMWTRWANPMHPEIFGLTQGNWSTQFTLSFNGSDPEISEYDILHYLWPDTLTGYRNNPWTFSGLPEEDQNYASRAFEAEGSGWDIADDSWIIGGRTVSVSASLHFSESGFIAGGSHCGIRLILLMETVFYNAQYVGIVPAGSQGWGANAGPYAEPVVSLSHPELNGYGPQHFSGDRGIVGQIFGFDVNAMDNNTDYDTTMPRHTVDLIQINPP